MGRGSARQGDITSASASFPVTVSPGRQVNRYGLGGTLDCYGFLKLCVWEWVKTCAEERRSVREGGRGTTNLCRRLASLAQSFASMERWRNKVAVVSGASAGIGAACTQALLRAGLVVVGLARRQERIEQLRDTLPREQQQRLHALHCDMRQESQVQQAIAWTQRQLGGLHVLVSNAGIIAEAELSGAGNTEAMRRTIETNIMGTVYGIREAFQLMRQQGSEGHVVIVNSVAGQQVPNLGPQLPSLNIYPASKFALRAMQEIYRQEFQRHKTRVRVSVSGDNPSSCSEFLFPCCFYCSLSLSLCRPSVPAWWTRTYCPSSCRASSSSTCPCCVPRTLPRRCSGPLARHPMSR